MYQLLQTAGALLAFSLSVHSHPFPLTQIQPGRILGSSFGTIDQNATYDYVIVGGGNAGLTLAYRLAENYTVAVIEAGGFYEMQNSNHSQIPADDIWYSGKDADDYNPLIDWAFQTTPQAVSLLPFHESSITNPCKGALNVSTHYARGRTLGGCTARNYMAYQRGTVDSHRMWANDVGDQDYTWENFLPYYERSLNFTPPDMSQRAANATPEWDPENVGDGTGPLRVTFPNYAQAFSSWAQRGLRELGMMPRRGFTSGALMGSSYVINTIEPTLQTRESSETAFLQPALANPNLILYTETMAKRILIDSDRVATGVHVQTGDKFYNLTAAREVIVSAGAFQSPQLLMVSGIGPRASLARHNIPVVADRPGVGQNMWVSSSVA